jgi:uncharacterized protein YecE (DUF72 family)
VHRQELEFASRRLGSIEVNGTFYAAQKPETFARWRDETPGNFVFSLKAPRYVTHRRALSSAGRSVERFLTGGVLELKEKLGPINWQLPPEIPFDASEFEGFLQLLPRSLDSRPLRHAVEVRHDTFHAVDCVEMARHYGVAIVIAADSAYPRFSDVTASFVYARLMGTRAGEPLGYAPDELDRWAQRARCWSQGEHVADLGSALTAAPPSAGREVFMYFISGHKVSNPAAAQALIQRTGS